MKNYLIIGAGPAGISTAVALKQRGISFDLVEAGENVGGIWDISRSQTPMYQSAHFISSKKLSGFSDFPMPDHFPDYPGHALVQAYLEDYVAHHQLTSHIQTHTRVLNATPEQKRWVVSFEGKDAVSYDGLICATGVTWFKNEPDHVRDFSGQYLHSFDYRDPSLFSWKRVLIIGGGNSGCDIACDAASAAKEAYISLRRGYYFIPKYIMGMPADEYKAKFSLPGKLDTWISQMMLNKLLVGDLTRYGLQKPDHQLMQSHPIINDQLIHYLGHGDILAKPDVQQIEGQQVTFSDGSKVEVDVIIAATGYKRCFPFLDPNHLDIGGTDQEHDFYLEIFSRKFENLFFVGGIEVSSAVFGLLGLQGQLIASFLAQESTDKIRQFNHLKNAVRNDSRKGLKMIPSERHRRYVEKTHYRKKLHQAIQSLS